MKDQIGSVPQTDKDLKKKRATKAERMAGRDGGMSNKGPVSGRQNSGQQNGKQVMSIGDFSKKVENMGAGDYPKTFGGDMGYQKDQLNKGIKGFFNDEVFTKNPKTTLADFGTSLGRGLMSGAKKTGNFLKDEVLTSPFGGAKTQVGDLLNRDTPGLGGEAVRFAEDLMPDVTTNATQPTTAADVENYRANVKYGTPGQAQAELDAGAGEMDMLGLQQSSVAGTDKYTDERTGETFYDNTGGGPDQPARKGLIQMDGPESGNSAAFGNMSDVEMARANAAYDLYHEDQMKQVAKNDQGLADHLRYTAAQKQLDRLGKDRRSLKHMRANRGINSRRYAEGLNKLAASAAMIQQGLGNPEQKAMTDVAMQDANLRREGHLENVRNNRAQLESANAKYLGDIQMKNRQMTQERELGVMKAAADAYGGGEFADMTLEDLMMQLNIGSGTKQGVMAAQIAGLGQFKEDEE